MSPWISPEVLVLIITVIFGAGVTVAVLRSGLAQARKDINAIGMSVRRNNLNLMIALFVIMDSRDDRQRLADLLRQQ